LINNRESVDVHRTTATPQVWRFRGAGARPTSDYCSGTKPQESLGTVQ